MNSNASCGASNGRWATRTNQQLSRLETNRRRENGGTQNQRSSILLSPYVCDLFDKYQTCCEECRLHAPFELSQRRIDQPEPFSQFLLGDTQRRIRKEVVPPHEGVEPKFTEQGAEALHLGDVPPNGASGVFVF